MKQSISRAVRLPGLVIATSFVLSGCAALAGGAAGAAAAIAYTERGASSQADASVDQVVAATEATFAEMGITIESRSVEEDGSEVEIRGQGNNMEIGVEIERDDPPTTQIEVYAHEDVVDFDREYARDILQNILERL